MKNQSKLFVVEEYHRGKWVPLMVEKDGKDVEKTVRITEDHAKIMSQGALDDVKEKKRTTQFRYTLKKEAPAKAEAPAKTQAKKPETKKK